MTRRSAPRLLAASVTAFLLGASEARPQTTFLVHLPSAPVEAASRLAEAVTALADYLSDEVPGLTLELQLFRRWNDAQDYLGSNGDAVVLLLTDASALIVAGEAGGFVPSHRFVRSGQGTYKRLLVVRTAGEGLGRLVDLRGKRLKVVETAGPSTTAFLGAAVFEGEIVPATWFGEIETVVDDFAATNAVLYGQADAALVAEHNPLLATHLGQDLKTVYASPSLSLPVLAVRASAFDAARRTALNEALARLGDDPRGRKAVDELKVDGFEILRNPEARALLSLPSAADGKEMEIALPAETLAFELPPLPSADQLLYTLTVELPDIPLPREEDDRDGGMY